MIWWGHVGLYDSTCSCCLSITSRSPLLGLQELPPAELARLEDAASRYNIGWSHGREALRDGKPDTHKGSFYANPMLDSVTEDTQLQAEFPAYARCLSRGGSV